MNKVKENLKAGKTVVGVAGAPNDVTMPLLADSAYDFILFDEQHSPYQTISNLDQ